MNSVQTSGWLSAPVSISPQMRGWLLNRGSLTRLIQIRCKNFRVEPVFQSLSTACEDELSVLGLRTGELAHIREVYLYCGKTPVVFAHSVVARKNLRGAWCRLGNLGNKSLGTVLFTNPIVKRTPLQFKKLNSSHPLFHRACIDLYTTYFNLWARRSLFSLHGQPILVTEVFLPPILDLAL